MFIPANLDVDSLLKTHPPFGIHKFKKEHLLYILHLITAIPATNKDLDCYKGFVPIYSPVLQKKVKNYREYLDYLISRARVLITNNHYIVGLRSKGYQFNSRFSKNVKPVDVNDLGLQSALKKESPLSANKKKRYSHVLKWYNSNLEIDFNLAMAYIKEDLNRKLKNPNLRDYDTKANQFKNPYIQYNCSSVNIERISNGIFVLSVDANVRRLHSAISNLKSEIRNCITYNGEYLVSIDIKNSQPYISTGILKSSFWDSETKMHSNSDFEGYLSINSISKTLLKEIFQDNNKEIFSFIMLSKSSEIKDSSDLQRYATLVQQGLFYEYFADEIGQELGIDYSDRKKVKAAVFQVLFTDNRFLGQEEARPKRIFKDRFPNVYDLFAMIKRHDKTNLPRLLQRIESHLMLLVVAKRITKEKPRLPILTIHDSIVTTVGNEEYVQSVLKDEMAKAIGFSCRGQELVKSIRFQESLFGNPTRIPIMILSMVDETRYPELITDKMVDHYLTKIMEPEDIIDCMEEILYC